MTENRITETNYTEFTSPINEDDGVKNHFIGHASSKMKLEFWPEIRSGRIEWRFTFVDGVNQRQTNVIYIHLYFDGNKRLISFEGVHELCDEAIKLLEDNGFNANIAKI